MIKIKFHGSLIGKFKDMNLQVDNVNVAMSGIVANYPELDPLLRSKKIVATKYTGDLTTDEEKFTTIHIMVNIEGESAIMAGIYTFIQWVGVAGAIYGLGVGIQQKRIQKQNKKKLANDADSFLFEGIINSDSAGGGIPLVFGSAYVGSVVINSELEGY